MRSFCKISLKEAILNLKNKNYGNHAIVNMINDVFQSNISVLQVKQIITRENKRFQ